MDLSTFAAIVLLWFLAQMAINHDLKKKIKKLEQQQRIRIGIIRHIYQGVFGTDSWAEVEQKAKDAGVEI